MTVIWETWINKSTVFEKLLKGTYIVRDVSKQNNTSL